MAVVHHRAVAADGTGGLQRLDAPRGRGSLQPHGFSHLVIGGPAVALQVAQNGRVQFVEAAVSGCEQGFCPAFKAGDA